MIQISIHYHKLNIFVLRKYSKTLIQQCRVQKIFRKQYPRTPVLMERRRGESLFLFSENVTKTLLQQCRIQTIFSGGNIPPDPVLVEGKGGEGKFVFVLRKYSKTVLSTAMQN